MLIGFKKLLSIITCKTYKVIVSAIKNSKSSSQETFYSFDFVVP